MTDTRPRQIDQDRPLMHIPPHVSAPAALQPRSPRRPPSPRSRLPLLRCPTLLARARWLTPPPTPARALPTQSQFERHP
eukprot:3260271-Rhodomonas_salina.4